MINFHDHGRDTFTPQRPIPVCRWDRFDLLAVHTGRLAMRFEERHTVELGAGMAVVVYPHTRFSGQPLSPSCEVSVQHFDFERGVRAAAVPEPMRRLLRRRGGFEPLRMRRPPELRRDIDRALVLAFEEQTPWMHDARVALLTLIFAQLDPLDALTITGDRGAWDSLDAWLRTQLHRPVGVEHIAHHMGLSTSHLTARFREHLGTSPAKHVHRLRMQEARRLLRETRKPIKAIADSLGYDDLPNFYRGFRAAVGETPSRYRNRYAVRG